MDTEKLKLAIEQAQKVCNEMNKCANKFILQDSINEMKEVINYTRCCTELPTKDDVYSEIKRLTDLYYNDDNARKSAFSLGVSTGVNLVNKEILK